MFSESDLIHSYTRANAIADGVLVDVTTVAREAGFNFPVALTRAAWEKCVAWTDDDNDRKDTAQDEAGRLWDVLFLAARYCKGAASSRIYFSVYAVPRDGKGTRPLNTPLTAVCGPGDKAEPVITIMLPGED